MSEKEIVSKIPKANLYREIKHRYLHENIEGEAPALEDLAEEFDVDLKTLRGIWSRQDWLGLRQQVVENYILHMDTAITNELAKEGVDIAHEQTSYIVNSLKLAREKIPVILTVLETRLTTMSDKDLIAYLKLITDIERNTIKIVNDFMHKSQERIERKEDWDEIKELFNMSTVSDLIEVIDGKKPSLRVQEVAEEYHQTVELRKSVFEKMDNKLEGLDEE